jgi:UDP-N-acetylmuramoyl-tripeptide--D-alanyl-D-alanine ligase
VESLPLDGWAILNGDDPLVAAMAERTSARVALFGESPQCSVRGTVLSTSGLEGISFRLTCDDESVDVSAPLPGRHNLYNALAAATVGLADGLSLQEVAAALAAADVLRAAPSWTTPTMPAPPPCSPPSTSWPSFPVATWPF